MGILELLTLIFVVLKLIGVIAWSWWLVLLPLLIALGIYLIIGVTFIIGYVRLKRQINREFGDFDKQFKN